jgi:hypothetical protein
VDPPAAARRVEFADLPSDPVRRLDREDVAVIRDTTITAADLGGGRRGEDRQREDE